MLGVWFAGWFNDLGLREGKRGEGGEGGGRERVRVKWRKGAEEGGGR